MRHILFLALCLIGTQALQAQLGNSAEILLNPAMSPDGRLVAVEIYGGPLVLIDQATGERTVVGLGSRPVWDSDGRLHFMTLVEGPDHTETTFNHVYEVPTGRTSLLPDGAPRPEFIATVPEAPVRSKRQVPSTASVTGLSNWTIFLDQGHSQTENQGLYGYSEAQKTLRVGLHLRQMLLEQTDIAAVHVARTTDNDLVSLTQRTDLANALGAHFYYSIHSDAGAPSANSTLMLWGANGQGVEKTPAGGRRMGDIMVEDLSASMRIGTRGSRADSPFYGATSRTTPFLHVNRETRMASVLSEAGFHTNPTQQQRNLNADWKKLEAQSAFWSILRYHGLSRPKVGILTGIVSDLESGRPLNGATITIGDRVYTTDTYESLFRFHSSNPSELANGFYYLEGLVPGGSVHVVLAAPGYYPQSHSIALNDTTFTFFDRGLVSMVPPSVAAFNAPDLIDPRIRIRFSRPMRRDSTEAAIALTPAVPYTVAWIDDLTIALVPDGLAPDTDHMVSISTLAEDRYAHKMASPYQTVFRTAPIDREPPRITSVWPANGVNNIVQRPIVTFEFDERLNAGAITQQTIRLEARPDGAASQPVPGLVLYVERGNRSALQFFPSQDLAGNTVHLATLDASVSDVAGNSLTDAVEIQFSTHSSQRTYTMLASFEGNSIDNWWAPQASGSTTGIVTELTGRSADDTVVNPLFGSTRSMRITYGFTANGSGLIREYLGSTTASLNPRFTTAGLLEAYIHGDGSGTLFRFMVRDGNNQLEGSPWTAVNWLGWRRVQWDLRPGQSVGWVNGNGVLDGAQLYTDSFQLMPSMSSSLAGILRIDDYRFVTIGTETDVVSQADRPSVTDLLGNYPNPFNPHTVIRWQMAVGGPARLAVYDVLGREVAILADGILPSGVHNAVFSGQGFASGVYLIRLTAGNDVRTSRMLLVK